MGQAILALNPVEGRRGMTIEGEIFEKSTGGPSSRVFNCFQRVVEAKLTAQRRLLCLHVRC